MLHRLNQGPVNIDTAEIIKMYIDRGVDINHLDQTGHFVDFEKVLWKSLTGMVH